MKSVTVTCYLNVTGRIVNVTSVKGRVSCPFNAGYGISKFGGETFSDILRLELKKWGITVSIIEPCNFGGATNCIDVSFATVIFLYKSMQTFLEN